MKEDEYIIDALFWSLVNRKTNVSSMLSHLYGLYDVASTNGKVTLKFRYEKLPVSSNTYGKGLNAILPFANPIQILQIIDKAHDHSEPEIFLYDRFTMDDNDMLISFPCQNHSMITLMPAYCEKHYKGCYDIRFTSNAGLHEFDAIIQVNDIEAIKEEVAFMMLQDGDVCGKFEKKIYNDVPLENEFIDEEEIMQGEA